MENNNGKIIKNDTLIYLGRELKKINLNPVEGKWIKRWQLNFETGRQYPLKLYTFEPLTDKSPIKLSDMEEGNTYSLAWNEEQYNHPTYGEQTRRTLFFVKEPETTDKPVPQPVQSGEKKEVKLVVEEEKVDEEVKPDKMEEVEESIIMTMYNADKEGFKDEAKFGKVMFATYKKETGNTMPIARAKVLYNIYLKICG